jgi:hypothetical protein
MLLSDTDFNDDGSKKIGVEKLHRCFPVGKDVLWQLQSSKQICKLICHRISLFVIMLKNMPEKEHPCTSQKAKIISRKPAVNAAP